MVQKKTYEVTGQGTPLKVGDLVLYDQATTPRIFPVGRYMQSVNGTVPCVCSDNREYTKGVLTFLREKALLINDCTSIPPNTALASGIYDGGDFWEEDEDSYSAVFWYNGCCIGVERKASRRASHTEAQDSFSLTYFHPPGTPAPLKDFEEFLFPAPLTNVIYTIMRDSGGNTTFEPFEVTTPKGYDLSLDYNEGFEDVSNSIVESLSQRTSGLYLFHGPPGTGKSTYLKYLASVVNREIIYVPTAFIDHLSDPSFMPVLLNKRNSVLLIEDAEKAILAREPGDDSSSLVSVLLNLTDGIMGDVFNISIIATYNSDRRGLDKALLRKGRLKYEYCFEKLTKSAVKRLNTAKNLGIDVTGPMSLAEVYNYHTENCAQEFATLHEEKRMGF